MIPLFRPELPHFENWLPYYERALITGHLTNFGAAHSEATAYLNQFLGGHWLLTNNGTTAISVMLLSLPVGSRVAVPDFTFAATALAVIQAGHIPVIIGCDFETRTFNERSLRFAEEQIDAILAVGCFGYGFDFKWMKGIADELRKPLFYDLAGCWPMVDPYGAPCSFSLHAAKSLPIGEGGMVRFPNSVDADLARRRISFGFNEDKSCQDVLGFNGKMDEIHASILLGQLANPEIEKRTNRHRTLIDLYQSELYEFIERPIVDHRFGFPSMCVLRDLRADDILKEGRKREIVFRKYYSPLLSTMRGFIDLQVIGESDKDLNSYIAFPTDPTNDEVDEVLDCVKAVYSR